MSGIHLGYTIPDAEPFSIPIFHTLICGQTQYSGKTTTAVVLAKRAAKLGYKVVIVDSKETRREFPYFPTVPIPYREPTDELVLIGLLESLRKAKLSPLYATLGRLAQRARNYDDIIQLSEEMEERARSGFVKDACFTIRSLMTRLKEQVRGFTTSTRLELPYDINVIAVNNMLPQGQQIVVKNICEDALRLYKKNLIIILDEAQKFIPEGYSSACRRDVWDVVTQGAATGLYVWITTQFLAPTEKDILKAMPVKIIGTQDHETEIKHSLALIPGRSYSRDDIMRLKVGQFIVVVKDPPKTATVYVDPRGHPDFPEITEDDVIAVAKGSVEKLPKSEVAVIMGREAGDILDRVARLEETTHLLTEKIASLTQPNKPTTQDMIREEIARALDGIPKPSLETIRAIIRSELERYSQGGEVAVNLVRRLTDFQVKVSREVITVDESTWTGKILVLGVEGFLNQPRRPSEIFTELKRRYSVGDSGSNRTRVSQVLADLVARGILVRDGSENTYTYQASPEFIYRVNKVESH